MFQKSSAGYTAQYKELLKEWGAISDVKIDSIVEQDPVALRATEHSVAEDKPWSVGLVGHVIDQEPKWTIEKIKTETPSRARRRVKRAEKFGEVSKDFEGLSKKKERTLVKFGDIKRGDVIESVYGEKWKVEGVTSTLYHAHRLGSLEVNTLRYTDSYHYKPEKIALPPLKLKDFLSE